MSDGANKRIPWLRWGAALVVLQAVYLVLELAFNARLVDSVSVASGDYFEYLAHVGRLLSGAGCTLFVFGLLQKWRTRSPILRVGAHVMAAAIAFPTIYHGQEMLIDSLADSSSAEQRVHAQYIALLKRGLATNAVVFKDVEFTPEDIERPEARTFINTIGFAVFFAPNYIQSVAENSDQILNHLAVRQANESLPAAYEGYLSARSEIAALSARYNEANQEFELKAQSSRDQAREIWAQTFASLQERWEQVQAEDSGARLADGVDELVDRLDLFFTARSRCNGWRAEACLQRVNEEYESAVLAHLPKPVPPEYWCKPIEERSDKILQGGQYVDITLGGGTDCSAKNAKFIEAQYLALYGVTSTSYADFGAFMASAEVAKEVRNQLAEKGIAMPESYRLRSHEGFIKGVEFELTKELTAAFLASAESEFGVAIPPRLSSEDFVQHAAVQGPLREALQLDAGAAPVAVDLSQRAFRDEVLVPQIERQLEKDRARILARTAYFADGEPYAEDGKQFVRGVLIPPVAMGLSLLFGLLNLASLGAVALSRSGLPKLAVTAGKTVFVSLVVLAPLVASSEIASSAPFEKIVNETQESLGVGRYYVVWLTSLQPVVYPLGAGLANALNLFEPQQ